MSKSRKNQFWNLADSLFGRPANKRREQKREQKPTKLAVDRLEDRQMLSLTVATTDNILVNDQWQDVRGDVSADSNDAGDMVVVWTAADRLANPDYDPSDPDSSPYLLDEDGNCVEDLNIYGRYLTNETQIVEIPEVLVTGNDVESNVSAGSFELVYNAFETQRFSIYKSNIVANTTEKETFTSVPDSTYYFNLGFYAEGELTWVTFKYDSTLLPTDNAANLQAAIRALPGGEYSDVEVSAYSETDFDIKFAGFAGEDVADVKVRSDCYNDFNDPTTGLLHGVIGKNKTTGKAFVNTANLTVYQKAILKDVYGDNYVSAVRQLKYADAMNKLQRAYDALSDSVMSGIATTVDKVRTITTYDSKTGASKGIAVSSDPFVTAQNIQNAFNAVSETKLYAPITNGYSYDEATRRYALDESVDMTRAFESTQDYGGVQGEIKTVEVAVLPVWDAELGEYSKTKFEITFQGASGLVDQDSLIVSAATYTQKTKTADKKVVYQKSDNLVEKTVVYVAGKPTIQYKYAGPTSAEQAYDSDSLTATTVKQNSSVFRVNDAEVADFVVDQDGDVVYDEYGVAQTNGTGRTDQSKPDVAMSADGTFVVVWESGVSDVAQPYNSSDIYARRFTVQGYVGANDDLYSSLSFYSNGTKDGFLGYVPPETAWSSERVADPYALENGLDVSVVQSVAPVADSFLVNAATNGAQTDASVAADSVGNFVVTWTSLAQDVSYFGGVYGRRFDLNANPLTGDITFAASQVGTDFFGPSDVATNANGFVVALWNYGTSLFQTVLAPVEQDDAATANANCQFILDAQLVSANAHGSSVAFDYNNRYAIAFTQEGEYEGTDSTDSTDTTTTTDTTSSALLEGNEKIPTTDVYMTVFEITSSDAETTTDSSTTSTSTDSSTTDSETTDSWVIGPVERVTSAKYTSTEVVAATLVNQRLTVGDQGNPSIAMDADGDLFVAYQGRGFDVQGVSTKDWEAYLLPGASETKYFVNLTYDDFTNNNLVYVDKEIVYDGATVLESKNEDLDSFVKLALGWGYDEEGVLVEEGGEVRYSALSSDTIDPDHLVKFFTAVAEKEGATDEQIARLNAILETLVSPLRNNGNDISFANYGQTSYTDAIPADATDAVDATGWLESNAGVVSAYRTGKNACFYLAIPNHWVSELKINIGIRAAADTSSETDPYEIASLDLTDCYSADDEGQILGDDNLKTLLTTISDALNALVAGETDSTSTDSTTTTTTSSATDAKSSFIVRLVDKSEIEFYRGTSGEYDAASNFNDGFEYVAYEGTSEGSDGFVTRFVDSCLLIEIVAQGDALHDAELIFDEANFKYRDELGDDETGYDLTLTNGSSTDAETQERIDEYTEDAISRFDEIFKFDVENVGNVGSSQTNPYVANTSNGDVTVVWTARGSANASSRSDLYPSVGNDLSDSYSHIYARSFVESTDNAGPTVANVVLPNGSKVQEGAAVASAVKDVVVSFSERMLTVGDGTSAYNTLHAVDSVQNWKLLRDGVEVSGAIESVTFGMNASAELARATVDEDGNPVAEINESVLAYGTNRWEAIVHFADGCEPTEGNYTLVCLSTVQDVSRNSIYSQGYATDGSADGYKGQNWTFDFSVVGLNEALAFEYSETFPRNDSFIPESYVQYGPFYKDVYAEYPDFSHLKQVTRSTIDESSTSDEGPNTAQAVATNSNGDYVVTWVDSLVQYGTTEDGEVDESTKTVTKTVWAKTYRQFFVEADGVRFQTIDNAVEGEENAIVTVKVTESVGKYQAQTKTTKKGEVEFVRDASGNIVYDLVSATNDGVESETFADPRQSSVAIDDSGDFVVVWDAITPEELDEDADGSRDVYVAKYAFNGGRLSLNGDNTEPMRVNVETEKDQQYAAVAMDADGDFVVVWESYEQDGSGWGIYGRRFMTDGYAYGYSNTIQTLQFGDQTSDAYVFDVQGEKLVLTLKACDEKGEYVMDGDKIATYDVTVDLAVEMKTNAERIEAALIYNPGTITLSDGSVVPAFSEFAATDVEVAVSGVGKVSIEFCGSKSAQYVELLDAEWIRPFEAQGLRNDLAVEMRQIGKTGVEFLVNQAPTATIGTTDDDDTTTSTTDDDEEIENEFDYAENNQRFASIAMARDGSFVVTWTSWTYDEKTGELDSDIYGRTFASNHVLGGSVKTVEERAITVGEGVDAVEKVISTDLIGEHETSAGGLYDSVGMITVGGTSTDTTSTTSTTSTSTSTTTDADSVGTGSLLTTRKHVLTAAHVVTDDDGAVTDEQVYVTFNTADGDVTIPVKSIVVHESWDGVAGGSGVDLAVLELAFAAPSCLEGYELYTGTDEVGQTITFAGYGVYGNVPQKDDATTEEDDDDDEDEMAEVDGSKHFGQNVYELTGADFADSLNPNVLIYDFDDGTTRNDYLGNYYGIRNLGLGDDEAITAQGDSGSPSLIDGKIAGVCSWGSMLTGDDDDEGGYIAPGNYQVDVRVSSYVDWINQVVFETNSTIFLVNTNEQPGVLTDDDDTTTTTTSTDDDDEETINDDANRKGEQKWSSVAMDATGNFVVTWTSYGQDGNGDSLTGSTNTGLGGIYARVFSNETESGTIQGGYVFAVNTLTAYDQVHSQVSVAANDDFVVVYESYQDHASGDDSDEVENYGVFARRYQIVGLPETTVSTDDDTTTATTDSTSSTSTTTTTTVDAIEEGATLAKAVGSEFRVARDLTRSDADYVDGDQLGISVALDANGDAVFVWTDLSERLNPEEVASYLELEDSDDIISVDDVVKMRALTLTDDDSLPYVVRADALYRCVDGESNSDYAQYLEETGVGKYADEDASQVSLYGRNVTFPSGKAPNALVLGFSEYMTSYQFNKDVKNGNLEGIEESVYDYSAAKSKENQSTSSILNIGNWTLTRNGVKVTSSLIADITYGYNATVGELDVNGNALTTDAYRRNLEELVISFSDNLPDGAYVLTLSDKVADAFGNKLDGDYDGEEGGSFSIRFSVGTASKTSETDKYVPETDADAMANGDLNGYGSPVVVSNDDGFIIVTEYQVLYEIGSSSTSTSGTTSSTSSSSSSSSSSTSSDIDSRLGYYETTKVETVDDDGTITTTEYRIESDIVLRRYNADGTPIGVEMRVNTYSDGNQINPDVALTDGGSYVVTWVGESNDAFNGVCARFYNGGVAQGKQVQVGGAHGYRCWDANVTIDDNGLVLVTWIQGKPDGTECVVMGKFFDLYGNAKSDGEFIVLDDDFSIRSFDVACVTDGGETTYVVVWDVPDKYGNTDIYQKTFAVRRKSDVSRKYELVETNAKERVNQTTVEGQYSPQIAMVDKVDDSDLAGNSLGDYYIVWVSDHNMNSAYSTGVAGPSRGADIYARKYSIDRVALEFNGTTGESCVNNTVAHRQYQPSVAANQGGVVFTWTSFDAEEYNYSKTLKEDRHDDCVCARVFNAAGQPINVANDDYAVGALVRDDDKTKGEFVVNTTTAGAQEESSVAVFDWSTGVENGQTYALPNFVVVWQGPNPNAGQTLDEDGTTTSTSTSTTSTTSSSTTDDEDGLVGAYSTFYKLIADTSVAAANAEIVVRGSLKSTAEQNGAARFASEESASSGSNGFYRPLGSTETPAAATTDVATAWTLTGTDGDDEIVIVSNGSGVVSVSLNGVSTTISVGATLQINGLGGNDVVKYAVADGESASYFAATSAFYGAVEIDLANVESFELTGAGSALTITASAGSTVELAPNAASATFGSVVFAATGFDAITAQGGATAILTGSDGDDVFAANAEGATATGDGFSLAATGFDVVRLAAGEGNDSATLSGLTALNAGESALVAKTSSSTIVAAGFESVDATGSGAVAIYGTRGDDEIAADAKQIAATYSTGAILTAKGFDAASIFGNGGNDRASLFAGTGLSSFEGRAGQATLKSGARSQTLVDFDSVAVYGNESGRLTATLFDTYGDDAFVADRDAVSLDVDGENAYSVIAADQVKIKRELGVGADSLDQADELDYLFSTENWDF